jgi:hypothetical protein
MKSEIKKNLTIEELYKWAVERNCTDFEIRIQYRDDGGYYFGCDEEVFLTINDKDKTVKL